MKKICLILCIATVVFSTAIQANTSIKLATFNIQIFGETKAAKPNVMNELASIIRKYDIVAVQEIKNSKGNVPPFFKETINSDGSRYDYIISERGGKQPDDKRSQEQYAYFYNTDKISLVHDMGLYDDSGTDDFQREPYVARFQAVEGDFSFVLITVHTKPDEAVNEIKALHHVFVWAKSITPQEDDYIALGDFNAGCDYANSTDFTNTAIANYYKWIVPEDADTNFSDNTACAYDRIIMTRGTDIEYLNNWGIDKVSSKKVSDHFPVWAEFSSKDQ